MGCCASSEAGVDAPARESKGLQRGVLREASTRDLGNNCSEGHPCRSMTSWTPSGRAVSRWSSARDKFTSENFAMKIINVSFDGREVRPGANPRDPSTDPLSYFRVIFTAVSPRTLPCDPNAGRATSLAVPSRANVPPTHRSLLLYSLPSRSPSPFRSSQPARRIRRRQGAHDREGGHVRDRDPAQSSSTRRSST